MVLDSIIWPTGHELGHLSPLGTKLLEQLEDELVLLGCEGRLVNGRIKMVVPSFTALLSSARAQPTCN